MSSLTSVTYKNSVNKYGVKCGGSLGMWESSGWITDCDPYGWFQWYCRFYQGRRCADDARQISRWCKSAGPKGRFRSQLCNKILAAHTSCDNRSISPVIRQTLLHWGLEITPDVLAKHRKRTGRWKFRSHLQGWNRSLLGVTHLFVFGRRTSMDTIGLSVLIQNDFLAIGLRGRIWLHCHTYFSQFSETVLSLCEMHKTNHVLFSCRTKPIVWGNGNIFRLCG